MYLATNEAAMLLFISGAGKDRPPATKPRVTLAPGAAKTPIVI
jgi:hypothetical protein